MDYKHEQAVAREAARRAAGLCLAIREEMLHQAVGKAEKNGREPVTIADYGAQVVVMQHIAEHFPGDGSLAEERASEFVRLVGEAERQRVLGHVGRVLARRVQVEDIQRWLDHGREQDAARRWVVDPIDGTKGFLRGDQFAVAVALLENGQPVVGALACPLMPYGSPGAADPRGVVAVAARGQGAALYSLNGGASRPMQVSTASTPAGARIVESVEIEHTDHDFSARVLELAGITGQPVRIDSQAKYVVVADGGAEIYLRNSRVAGYHERVWDHAAGVLIVEEAGGRVTDLDGRPVDFSQGPKLSANRGVLATNGAVHDTLLEAIRAYEKSGTD